MKVIDLLNKIANREEVPKQIKYKGYLDYVLTYDEVTQDYYNEPNCTFSLFNDIHYKLNDEVEIIEEKKKISEKHINKYGNLIILGQQDNWTQKFNIKTKEMETTGIELNPYVFEAINENFKDIENKIYEIIDYLKSKGE